MLFATSRLLMSGKREADIIYRKVRGVASPAMRTDGGVCEATSGRVLTRVHLVASVHDGHANSVVEPAALVCCEKAFFP
jgi:hypothetical protein